MLQVAARAARCKMRAMRRWWSSFARQSSVRDPAQIPLEHLTLTTADSQPQCVRPPSTGSTRAEDATMATAGDTPCAPASFGITDAIGRRGKAE
jgi:hypothetical protein